MYGGGFNVVEPPMLYEPRPRFIQRPRGIPVVRKIRQPVVERRVKYVLPHERRRQMVIKKTYDPPDARIIQQEPINTVVPLAPRQPVYDLGRDYYDGGYWNPPDIVRPHRTAPTYINYKVKPLLPPIHEGFHSFPEVDFERDHREMIQAYPSEDSFEMEPPIIRHKEIIRPRYSLPEIPRFYYHQPIARASRRVEYVDDYDDRSMIPIYRPPRKEQYWSYDLRPTEGYRNKRLRYLTEQRRQQGLI